MERDELIQKYTLKITELQKEWQKFEVLKSISKSSNSMFLGTTESRRALITKAEALKGKIDDLKDEILFECRKDPRPGLSALTSQLGIMSYDLGQYVKHLNPMKSDTEVLKAVKELSDNVNSFVQKYSETMYGIKGTGFYPNNTSIKELKMTCEYLTERTRQCDKAYSKLIGDPSYKLEIQGLLNLTKKRLAAVGKTLNHPSGSKKDFKDWSISNETSGIDTPPSL